MAPPVQLEGAVRGSSMALRARERKKDPEAEERFHRLVLLEPWVSAAIR